MFQMPFQWWRKFWGIILRTLSIFLQVLLSTLDVSPLLNIINEQNASQISIPLFKNQESEHNPRARKNTKQQQTFNSLKDFFLLLKEETLFLDIFSQLKHTSQSTVNKINIEQCIEALEWVSESELLMYLIRFFFIIYSFIWSFKLKIKIRNLRFFVQQSYYSIQSLHNFISISAIVCFK